MRVGFLLFFGLIVVLIWIVIRWVVLCMYWVGLILDIMFLVIEMLLFFVYFRVNYCEIINLLIVLKRLIIIKICEKNVLIILGL